MQVFWQDRIAATSLRLSVPVSDSSRFHRAPIQETNPRQVHRHPSGGGGGGGAASRPVDRKSGSSAVLRRRRRRRRREPPHLHSSETPAEAAPRAAAWTSYELESTRTRSILGYLECVTIPVAAAAAAEDCLAVGAAEFFKDARLWKVLLVSRTTYVVGLQYLASLDAGRFPSCA